MDEFRSKKIEAAAQKIFYEVSSSSEDEGEYDEKSILDSVFQKYQPSFDLSIADFIHNGNGQRWSRTSTFLENVLHSSASCLICIGSIRRAESIWSCKNCFCFFHLNCIQRWARDSLVQMKAKAAEQQNDGQAYYNHQGEYVQPLKPKKSFYWSCPQCRKDYSPNERPEQYKCFCEKEINPLPQPFIVPHSCGEICGKQLQPKCGHECKLLCHPGPCPPCAQLAQVSCLCKRSSLRTVRCIDKEWKCEQICQELLKCGKHECKQNCHEPGLCPPCSSKSTQPCKCKREVKSVNCAQLIWRCQNVCGAAYLCGLHRCEKVCHDGPCGDCPLSLPRPCPCGKNIQTIPCSQSVDTCCDTCQKLLHCGLHTCAHRCHRGACNKCLAITKKKCRCGLHEKEVPCYKVFTCDTKCRLMRDCCKHMCNRKCCDGHCAPCEKICGKQLNCNKHKCQSVCHNGPCFPCQRESQVNCHCGKTRKSVPCGRERSARIVCLEQCRTPKKCHHVTIHRCHKGPCPPCREKCGLPNDSSDCKHICEARCHAAVPLAKDIGGARGDKNEYKALPHPKCEKDVTVSCFGGHAVAIRQCFQPSTFSCGERCGRKLNCGNHLCTLVCHPVPNPHDKREQIGCATCEERCDVPRPLGCKHACLRLCHPPPCEPCNFNIKNKCHCGLNYVLYKCREFFDVSGASEAISRQEHFLSCGNRCFKEFACGHRCKAICHSGKCPNPELCCKKVRIFCSCKRIKLEISCEKHRAGLLALKCDEQCAEEYSISFAAKQKKIEQELRNEQYKNQLEIEKFEKKSTKRKIRIRKSLINPTKPNTNWRRLGIIALAVLSFVIAVSVAFYADG